MSGLEIKLKAAQEASAEFERLNRELSDLKLSAHHTEVAIRKAQVVMGEAWAEFNKLAVSWPLGN